jgi:hypothetical protein
LSKLDPTKIQTTTYLIDDLGRVVEVQGVDPDGTGNLPALKHRYTYNKASQLGAVSSLRSIMRLFWGAVNWTRQEFGVER